MPAAKADDYYGSASFVRTSPDLVTKSINVELTFDEAVKLSLALQSAVLALSRYNRGAKSGREMGLQLSLKNDNRSIAVIEKRIVTKSS